METRTFDDLARSLGHTLNRRSTLRGLAASAAAVVAGGAVLQAEDASAKKRRKNKDKKKQKNKNNNTPPPNPAPLGAVVTCPNLGTACGLGANTLVCNCRLTKEGTQTCANVVNPPNGAAFQACQQTVNCPPGQICDFGGNVCRSTCQTA
jgi:anaerobic selenocysteine-containing dehydrogenase